MVTYSWSVAGSPASCVTVKSSHPELYSVSKVWLNDGCGERRGNCTRNRDTVRGLAGAGRESTRQAAASLHFRKLMMPRLQYPPALVQRCTRRP